MCKVKDKKNSKTKITLKTKNIGASKQSLKSSTQIKKQKPPGSKRVAKACRNKLADD